jgi:hypothetical protein
VSDFTLYPCPIHLTGHPAQHWLAGLTVTFDTNDAHETRVALLPSPRNALGNNRLGAEDRGMDNR